MVDDSFPHDAPDADGPPARQPLAARDEGDEPPASAHLLSVRRMRLTFSKLGATRYISHLDLARALERALNRAGLPVAYTQGFNRRPRLSLAAALPLGYTSQAEVADVWLTEPVAVAVFQERLMARMAPGIVVTQVEEVPPGWPSLQQLLAESEYAVTFADPVDEAALRGNVAALLAADSLPIMRQRAKDRQPKPFDLRPLLLDARVEAQSDASGDPAPVLHLRLVQTATQTGRPDEVLSALGFDPLDCHVHRTALHFRSPN